MLTGIPKGKFLRVYGAHRSLIGGLKFYDRYPYPSAGKITTIRTMLSAETATNQPDIIEAGPFFCLLNDRLTHIVSSLGENLETEARTTLLAHLSQLKEQRSYAAATDLRRTLANLSPVRKNLEAQAKISLAQIIVNLFIAYQTNTFTIPRYFEHLTSARNYYAEVTLTRLTTRMFKLAQVYPFDVPLPATNSPYGLRTLLNSIFFFIGRTHTIPSIKLEILGCEFKPEMFFGKSRRALLQDIDDFPPQEQEQFLAAFDTYAALPPSPIVRAQKVASGTTLDFEYPATEDIGQYLLETGPIEAIDALCQAATLTERLFKGSLNICQEESGRITIVMFLPDRQGARL